MFLLGSIGLLPATAAWAQQGSPMPAVADSTSPAPKEPGHALVASRHGALQESVNPANGQLSLRYDLPLPPGLQLTPRFAIAYESSASNYLENLAGGQQATLLASDGWSYTAPLLTFSLADQTPDPGNYPNFTCAVASNFVLQTADGAHHQLALTAVGESQGVTDPTGVSCIEDSNPNDHRSTSYYSQIGSANQPDGWFASTPTTAPLQTLGPLANGTNGAGAVTAKDPDG
ncbi:MAG TPA: hypothetical protein VN690_07465, partial [Terriglobales bacterium]|nr:hypothetical protein [Terriglobales bacterium]